MSKFQQEIKDGKVKLGYDGNEDGQASVSVEINLTEAVQEALRQGEEVEGAKVAEFRLEGADLVIKLDTDKDGEQVLDLRISLMEGVDELGLMK